MQRHVVRVSLRRRQRAMIEAYDDLRGELTHKREQPVASRNASHEHAVAQPRLLTRKILP
jgi:hypothetical protein